MNKEKLIDVLSQPSTWSGIVLLLTAFGISIDEDHTVQIVQSGITLTGIIRVFLED